MWGSVTRLINLVGMSKAKEMIMTCDELRAEEALKIGLINQLVPAEQLGAAALDLAGKLTSKPPMALRRTKDFFKALGNGRLADITYADGYLGLSCVASDDMAEATAVFKEKRPGRFSRSLSSDAVIAAAAIALRLRGGLLTRGAESVALIDCRRVHHRLADSISKCPDRSPAGAVPGSDRGQVELPHGLNRLCNDFLVRASEMEPTKHGIERDARRAVAGMLQYVYQPGM